MQPLVIAMATDQNYIDSLLTAIKSLMYHNDHVKIYVINTDIPQEWFSNLNRFLSKLDSQIIDKKIDEHSFDDFATPGSYFSYLAYGRLLIPKLISEKKVLYLDSDTIVNDDLHTLFSTSLGEHYIGAVHDCTGGYFNSGVLLIDNWRLKHNKDKLDQLFRAAKSNDNWFADQSALNTVFNTIYLPLNDKYNYMIGSQQNLFYNPVDNGAYFDRLSCITHPIIIHYNSDDKPWKLTSGGTMRNIWWQYHDLSWSEIIQRSPLPSVYPTIKGRFFTFTRGFRLENLTELVKAMPDFELNIASWTAMAPELMHFIEYPNVRLFPAASGPKIDELCQQMDAYLDINIGDKEVQFIDRADQLGKPILAFQNSVFDSPRYSDCRVFADNDVAGMVTNLKNICQKERS